jgi:two-component system cell cycle response regulator
MRILLADDEDVARFRLEALLSKGGYEVTAVKDGAAAWEALQEPDAPPLAIIDWVMPGMTGVELCQKLRASPGGAYVYVIMLTAKGEKSDIVAGMDAGADDYLSKPFDMEELRVRLRAGERILTLQEQLRVQATRDALTGVLNRGTIFDLMERYLAQSVREKTPLAVILVDLDHFKQVNDTHGHQIGDAVLREAAKRLGVPMRAYDALGRYGGEEFLIVLPKCTTENAREVAERVRTSLASASVETPTGALAVRASMGVASTENAALGSIEALVQAADEALYRAKRAGRDRVECAA